MMALFPVSCGGCGQPLSHRPQYLLCQLCLEALADNPESEGGRLISGIPYYAPYLYGGPVEDMIWASKFRGRIDLSRQLGHLLMDAPQTASMIAKSDLLVPVPLSPIRGFQRGFNQSFEIARVLADRGQRPIHRGWRRKHRHAQHKLNREARLTNLRGAFLRPKGVENKRVFTGRRYHYNGLNPQARRLSH